MKLPIASYSFFSNFENCPHKAYHIYVARTVPYVETPEMAWGNAVHAAFEKRIRDGVPLPESMAAGETIASEFADYAKTLPVKVEYQLAMTKDGKPCEWKGADAWFRGKLDCVVMPSNFAWMVDWKTGNVREDPFELQCGALLLQVNHEIDHSRGEYFWLKEGKSGLRYEMPAPLQTYEKLLRLWDEVEGYFQSGEWPKRKNPLCGYCGVTSCDNRFDAKAGEKVKRPNAPVGRDSRGGRHRRK